LTKIEVEQHRTSNKFLETYDAWVSTCTCGWTTGHLGGQDEDRREAARQAVQHRLEAKGLI